MKAIVDIESFAACNLKDSTNTNAHDFNLRDSEDGSVLPPLPVTGHSPRKLMTYKAQKMNGKRYKIHEKGYFVVTSSFF